MNKTHKIILLISLALLIGVFSSCAKEEELQDEQVYSSDFDSISLSVEQEAQVEELKGQHPDCEDRFLRFAVFLSLTEEQIDQIYAIFQAAQEKKDEIRNDDSLDCFEKRDAMQSYMEETRAQIEALLTEEQLEIFNNLKNETDSRRRKKGKMGGGMGRFQMGK